MLVLLKFLSVLGFYYPKLLTRQCITLIQEINTIFIDRLLTCRAFRKVHPTLGSEFLTAYHEVLQILRMKRHNLR